MIQPKLEKERDTVMEDLEKVAKLLERMGQVRPEFASLAERVRSFMEGWHNIPKEFAEVFEDELMSRALSDALDLAVSIDPTNHQWQRLQEIVSRKL